MFRMRNILLADTSYSSAKYLYSVLISLLLFMILVVLPGCAKSTRPAFKPRKYKAPTIAQKSRETSKRISLAFSQNNKMVIISGTNSIRLWDIQSAKPVCNVVPKTTPLHVGFTSDDTPFYGSSEKYIFWDKHTGEPIKELPPSTPGVNNIEREQKSLLLSQDASRILELTRDDTKASLLIKDVITGKKICAIPFKWRTAIDYMKFSSNGKYLAMPTQDGCLVVLDTDTGKQTGSFKCNTATNDDYGLSYGSFTSTFLMCMSPDSRYIASVETISGVPTAQVSAKGGINIVSIDTSSINSTLNVFSMDKVKPIIHLELIGTVNNVVFAPDGKTFAVLNDGKGLIYDIKTRTVIRTLLSNNEPVMAITFSRDNKYIATGDGIGTLKIWDKKTGKELLSLER